MVLEVNGIITPMVTPLNRNETLDEGGMREIINYLIENGIHGVFVCGSTGESFALTEEEKKRAMEVAVDEVNGRVPVYAGAGDITTEGVVKLTKYALDIGADAVVVITPFYIRPTQEELYEHYRKVSETVDIPIIPYNNPGRTGVNLGAPVVSRLAELSNIVGIKDSSGDLTLTADYIRLCPKKFSILQGKDSLILASLVYGAEGAVAATANVVPRLVVEIYESFVKGDLEKARKLQFKLLPLRLAFELGTFPTLMKEAMNLIGKPSGPAKEPVTSLSKENREKLKSILTSLGFDV